MSGHGTGVRLDVAGDGRWATMTCLACGKSVVFANPRAERVAWFKGSHRCGGTDGVWQHGDDQADDTSQHQADTGDAARLASLAVVDLLVAQVEQATALLAVHLDGLGLDLHGFHAGLDAATVGADFMRRAVDEAFDAHNLVAEAERVLRGES